MVTTRPPKTIVQPTALGPVANTDTKLLIYGLFQKVRVLAQDGMVKLNRSMNDVFNVEESSELLSASSNRHAAPCSALRSTLMIRSFLRVLRTWP